MELSKTKNKVFLNKTKQVNTEKKKIVLYLLKTRLRNDLIKKI